VADCGYKPKRIARIAATTPTSDEAERRPLVNGNCDDVTSAVEEQRKHTNATRLPVSVSRCAPRADVSDRLALIVRITPGRPDSCDVSARATFEYRIAIQFMLGHNLSNPAAIAVAATHHSNTN